MLLSCEKENDQSSFGKSLHTKDGSAMPSHELRLAEQKRFVQIVEPSIKPFTENVPFIGIFSPTQIVSLHFALPGRVRYCPAREGVFMKKGEVICSLDSEVVDLEIKRARAAVTGTESILESNFLEKQRSLFESGVIGQTDYEQIRIQNETALATLKDSKSLLELALQKKIEHEIRAPWDGVVSSSGISPGQLVSPEVNLGVITSRSGKRQMRLEIKLHASWYGRVNKNDKALIDSVAGKNFQKPLEAIVIDSASSINPETQMFKVWLDIGFLESSSSFVTEGMLARGQIILQVAENGIVLPASTLITWRSDDTAELFVVDSEDKLRLREVRVDAYAQDEILIGSGVLSTDKVVARFASDLYDGLPVRYKNMD